MEVEIELAAIDKGAGPPAILVHGGVFHAAPAWARNIGPLAAAGFRVIAPDRRGHGRSEPGDADHIPLYLHANDLRLTLELRDAAVGLNLIGVSYGALVCIEFARNWPERVDSMILVEPPLFTWLKADPDYREWYERFEEIARTRADLPLEEWMPKWLSLMDSRMAKEVNPASPAWRIVEKQAPLIFKEEAGWQYELDPGSLGSFDFPVLVINGDMSEPAMQAIGEQVVSRLPNATHSFIPGGGHDPHARNFEDFNATIIDWLAKNAKPEAH